jgi:hypothetical protein
MSILSDQFAALFAANKPDNVTRLITPVLDREILAFVEDNAVWKDQIKGGGFSGSWKLISASLASPSNYQITTDATTFSSISEINIHRNAIGPLEFNNTINKISSLKISSSDGEEAILEVNSINHETSYVNFEVSPTSGTLTSMIVNDDYTISFMYGEFSKTVTNYFCTTWAEVKSAVVASNASNGGNIYTTGTLIVTESITWDLTGITFYGEADWIFLNEDFQATGDNAFKITVSAGDPLFNRINFLGAIGAAGTQNFALYSSRPILKFEGVQSPTFINCEFVNVVGGSGTESVIGFSNITVGFNCEIKFNGCVTKSQNLSGTQFLYNGLTIGVVNFGILYVTVLNQSLSLINYGTDNSALKYEVNATTPANLSFYNDESAYGDGDIDNSNSYTPTINARNQAPILADTISFISSVDGQVYKCTLTQLQTLINV